MIDKHSRQWASFGSGNWWGIGMTVLAVGWSVWPTTAQESGVSADPAAASGMTTGLPGVSTQRQAEMMQIRARAQAARPDAQRAAMERSAEDALAQKSEDQLLDEVRETKRMKEEAARQLQYQRAANAYQGVSAREMNAWADDSGRVKVERGVPPEVLAALPPEEESTEVDEDEGGFNPLKMPKRAAKGAANAAGGAAGAAMGAMKKGVSWIPGLGKNDEPETGITAQPRTQEAESYADDSQAEGGGMLSRIPLVGGMMNRDSKAEEPSPTQVEASDPAEKKGFFRGITSNLPLVGGRDEPSEMALISDAPANAPAPPTGSEAMSFGPPPTAAPAPMVAAGDTESGSMAVGAAEEESGGFFSKLPLVGSRKTEEVPTGAFGPNTADTMPPVAEEKSGIGGGFKNLVGKVIPGNGGRDSGGMAAGSGNIDASLFPQEGDPDELMADTSSTKRKLFKMPELPDISIPTAQPEKPTPDTPMPKKERSPVHSGGNAVYVVQTDGAQFMRFAGGPLGSEAQSLSAGTQVRMTKVGDEWSSVQLSNGSVGIVKNKDLKPSSGGGGFASETPTTGTLATNAATGSARITSPVSATGAGVSDVPGPPVTMPESQLATGIPPISLE